MPIVAQIEQALFQLAPKDLAFDWDNVGHLEGSPDQEVQRVLVALDVTENVVSEAEKLGCQLIVSHHPLMNVRWHQAEMRDSAAQPLSGPSAAEIGESGYFCDLHAYKSGYCPRRRQRRTGRGTANRGPWAYAGG